LTSGYKFETREDLDTAVSLWIDNETSATETYGDINTWDVSSITDFSHLFGSKTSFNSDISNWDVSSGTSFTSMFISATSFNQDISAWDVSNGTGFASMFSNATAFNQDISSWDVSNGTSFASMFAGATIFDQDISSWNVSSGTKFIRMFRYADEMISKQGVDITPNASYFKGITENGTADNETINGSKGNDVLSGLGGDDEIKGGDGWDKLKGGAGDDTLDGGEKDDTAIYSGKKDDYLINEDNSIFIIQDLRDDSPDGTDSLKNIEFIKFSDQRISINNDPITGQTFNLDVDGNGKVSALGDGLMVIRKLFGAAFDGDKLTSKAISDEATRTTQEIHDFIQGAIDDKTLDVDGDGSVTALGDGLMVIRKLFGAAFDGSKLTDKAISNDATRTTDEIHEYIAAMSSVDPVT